MLDNRLLDKWKAMVSHLKETWDELTEIEIEEGEKLNSAPSKQTKGRKETMKNQDVLVIAILTSLLGGCAVFQDRESPGQYMDDAGITTRIKSELIAEPALNAAEIHVDTFKNTVQLSGFVSNLEQARIAERIARNTSGVRKVVNSIKIRR